MKKILLVAAILGVVHFGNKALVNALPIGEAPRQGKALAPVPRRLPTDTVYHEQESPEFSRNVGIRIRYPALALMKNTQGVVIERIVIAPDGHVENTAFLQFVTVGTSKERVLKKVSKPDQLALVAEAERVLLETQFEPSASRTVEVHGVRCLIKQ